MCESSRFAVVPNARYSRRNVVGRILVSLSILWAVGANGTAFALDGVWINPSGGSWNNVDDWLDDFVAFGTDGIADFSTLDITADVTMHLGPSPITIGQLKFGDTTPSNNWILDNTGFPTNVLTLSVTSGSPTITVVNDAATISATLAGTQGMTKSGAGTLVLSGANTFTGVVTINAGNLQLASAGALNFYTPNAVAFGPNSSGTLSLNGTSVTINGLSSNLAVGTPIVQNGSAAPVNLTVNNAVDNTFAGILQDGGPGYLALTKSGAGTLTLGGNNTFTGGVLINGGTVQVANAGALNAAAPNQVFFNPSSTGILSLNGNSVAVNGLDTSSPTGTPVVQNASALNIPATLTVQGPDDHIYAGVLQDGPGGGKLSLTKIGEGMQELKGANTFTGEVNVNAGTLDLNGGSLVSDVHNQAEFRIDSGVTFAGRLFNAGTAAFFAPFTAGNGMENHGTAINYFGVNVTLNGAGLNNQGSLYMEGGTLTVSSGSTILNGGSLSLDPVNSPVTLNLAGATLTNTGVLTLNGGTIAGAGLVFNDFGGTLLADGVIDPPLINNGTITVNGFSLTFNDGVVNHGVIQGNGSVLGNLSNAADGSINVAAGDLLDIANPFTNSGLVMVQGSGATLSGATIANANTIQGAGVIDNAITNTGTIEALGLGGTLSMNGALSNLAGGMLKTGVGTKLIVTTGLAANAGIINLAGGTFDNNGHVLNNTGQINGWGFFRTGGAGLDNNGSITFNGGMMTVTGPVTNEDGRTIMIAQNPAIFAGMVINNGGATVNTLNATATFAGGFTNNANSNFVKAGNGVVEINTAPTLNNSSTLSVTAGTLRFNVVSGSPTIGTGVTSMVSVGATLELAGTVSALANGSSRVNIINNSAAPGLLVSGTNQVVGAMDGSGNTVVNAGSDLTANHIIQGALVIGGTAGSHGLVTIDASDASGNSLGQSSGFTLAGSLTPSGPFGTDGVSSADLSSASGADPATPLLGNSAGGGNPSSVPEPSALLLTLLAVLGVVSTQFARHHFRW